jgi:predicted nucleic acid-binding Zn ribbon protein
MTEPPRKRCPKCRGKVRRLVSGGAGIVFKGSGFYATDYRSNAYKEQKRKESGEPAKPKGESKDSGRKKKQDSGS